MLSIYHGFFFMKAHLPQSSCSKGIDKSKISVFVSGCQVSHFTIETHVQAQTKWFPIQQKLSTTEIGVRSMEIMSRPPVDSHWVIQCLSKLF